MAHKIELLSQSDNFTIGTNSNLAEILANVVKVGTDTSNVTISIPQDISSSYNIILPVRQGASGESLVYGADGQLKWHDPTVLKQVVSVYGSTLTGNLISTTGSHDSPTYLDAYTANITPMGENSKIFVQFKINYHAALSVSNQISFFIKKTYDGNETIFTESLLGPYNGAGGFTGQYISNLLDEALTTSSISYQLGYKINGNVQISDTLGILGYDTSYNNTIFLQEFEGSGSNAASVWNKGADGNGLYYNDGTVHIGSSKNAVGSQNTVGVALELSGNLVGTNANFSGEVSANVIRANDGYFSSNTLYINNKPVLNEDASGNRTVNTDVIVSDASNGLTIKAIGDNGNIILDPSGTGSIQLNGDVQLSGGNINAVTFIGDLSGNVTGTVFSLSNHTTDDLSEGSTNKYYTEARVRGDVSGGLGINYNESTGIFSLPQEVSTSSDVNFNNVTASSSLVTHNAQINNDLTVNKDLTVAGNITVSGTQTIVNSRVVEIGDNKIVLNSSGLSTNDAGIIANVNNSQYEFYFKTDDTAWYANEAIQSGTGFIGNVTGNVTGNVIGNLIGNVTGNVIGNVIGNLVGDVIGNVTGNLVGDVTGDVTGNVSGVLTGSMTMTGHILPDTNAAYDIGSAEHKVRHMYLSNNSLWIGDEHKVTINPYNNQLEFKRRKRDAIPQSFITAGINDTSQILSAAGVGELTEMTLGKWKQVARSLGITINGKSNLDIDPTDIFDTGQTDDWQTSLDIKTIQDDVSVLQTSLNTVQVTADAANSLATTNATSIDEINTSLTTVQGTADAANSLATTNATSIDTINTSLASKQNTITETTDLTMQNLTLSGYLRGPTNMIIDPETHSDNTGTLTVKGSLQVLGTTTTINSETLTINDNSIILNNNYSGSSPSENASIEIERGSLSNAIIQWNEGSDQWEFYREGISNLSNIKCNTIKVNNDDTLGSISASFSESVLTINGNANISYGVCTASNHPTTLSTLSVSNIEKNTQILIYYHNNSGNDVYINNTLTISGATCKTNLSKQLTISSNSSALFCIFRVVDVYILTVSQLD